MPLPPAIDAATRAVVPRLPFRVRGCAVGSVAAPHLPALRRFPVLRVGAGGVDIDDPAALRAIGEALRDEGLVRGWRDEVFSLLDPQTLRPVAMIERAAARFWGALTLGAHATGYVAAAGGRPSQLWIARRSLSKSTDPGLHDNLIGGGVAAGQTPQRALVREGFEEAGLPPERLIDLPCRGVLRLARDIAEGFQHEWLYTWDVEFVPGDVPRNQDGEVGSYALLPLDEALALAAGSDMTVDAAVVTLDFALRHGFVDDPEWARGIRALRVDAAQPGAGGDTSRRAAAASRSA